jgi:hypothetical protein
VNRTSIATSILAVALFFAGCGGGGSTSSTAPTQTATRTIGVSGNLAFGNVPVGQTSNGTMTLTNSGTGTLTVSGMSGPAGFNASWTTGTIAAGGSQASTISFSPTAVGSYGGTITVQGDQTGGTNTIAVSGMGTIARANVVSEGSATWTSCLPAIGGFAGTCQIQVGGRNTGVGCAKGVAGTIAFLDGQGNQIGARLTLVPIVLGGTLRPNETFSSLGLSSVPLSTVNATKAMHAEFSWNDAACP